MEHAQMRHVFAHKSLLWLTYLMYLFVVPAIVAVCVNYYEARQLRVVVDNSAGEEAEDAGLLWSHHAWLCRTFLTFTLLGMVAVGTMFYGFGYPIGVGLMVWWIYRITRGMLALRQAKPLPVAP